ncbi:MAG: rhodanese-like domain-containing protein [Acidobacteriota bacterium]
MPESEAVPFEIDVETLKAWVDEGRSLQILDVREPHEYEICQIQGSQLLPIREIPQRFDELDREALTVVHCHHGPRSSQVVMYLRQQGFEQVTNLGGGIDAWSLRIDSSVPRY